MTRRVAGRASVLLVVLALMGAACAGDDGPTAGAAERVRAAGPATLEEGTARLALRLVLPGPRPTTVAGEGVVDFAGRRGALNLDYGDLGAMLAAADGPLETVLEPAGVFVRVPGLIGPDKPWVKVDLAALDDVAGVDVGPLGQLQSADPVQALAFLLGAGEMRKVGEERLRGTPSTRYRGVLDLAQAAAAAPPELGPSVEAARAALGGQPVPVEVWLDDEGRARKLRLETGSGEGKGTVEMELFDFGVPADVVTPPASQVTDLTWLFGG